MKLCRKKHLKKSLTIIDVNGIKENMSGYEKNHANRDGCEVIMKNSTGFICISM
jgi:hypothetical protein